MRNDGPPSNPLGRGFPDAPLVQSPILPVNIIRQPLRIATWNVLTLNPQGHDVLLATELARLRVSIAGLQEVRWTGHGEVDVGDYHILWSGQERLRIQGVALVVHKQHVSSIVDWKPISSRLIYARFKHSHGYLSIFSCYAPTDASDSDTKDEFYHLLREEIRRISNHDIVIVLGDMNASTGLTRPGLEHIIGPHALPAELNDNCERMMDFCATSTCNLKPISTWFQHRDIHRMTWHSNTGNVSKCIDHVLISGRWRVASDCRVFRSAELGSTDHRLVLATVHLRLHKKSPPANSKRRLPDIQKLSNPEYAVRYSVEVSNRFALLESPQNLEESWDQFRSTLAPAAFNVLGERRYRKKPWISEASLDLVDKCRRARLTGSMTNYRALNIERRRSLRHDFNSWLHRIADSAEKGFNSGNLRPAYKSVRELCQAGRKCHSSSTLLSNDGNAIIEPTAKMERWREHYSAALNKAPIVPSEPLLRYANAGIPDDTISLEPPTPEEVANAIKKTPTGRAPGADEIPSEFLKASLAPSAMKLVELCRLIWKEERVPNDWKEGVILPIYKNKGDRRCTSSYRPITLLSVPSKIVTAIILRRIQPLILSTRRPQQAGFTPKRSTSDCILALRVLAQQRREYRQPLLAAYIDLKSAFDSIDRGVLWLLLKGIGVPSKYIAILRDLYSDTYSRVRTDGKLSAAFPTTSGVRQGCVAAPNLFNTAVDFWLSNAFAKCPNLGVDYHSRITDLSYADDVVIFASLIDTISDTLHILGEEASPLGLSINWTKTKVQSLSDFLPPQSSINVRSEQVDMVEEFLYLGSKISSDCSSSSDVERRLSLARATFGRLSRVWRSGKIRTATKMRLLNTCVLSVLLYGSEAWTLTTSYARRIDAFHRNCLRNILGIRWYHRRTNEEVYASAGHPSPLSVTIKKGRLRLVGHIARLDNEVPAKQILLATSRSPPDGWRRPRGRPRLTWSSQIEAFCPIRDLFSAAEDRAGYRRLVATVTT